MIYILTFFYFELMLQSKAEKKACLLIPVNPFAFTDMSSCRPQQGGFVKVETVSTGLCGYPLYVYILIWIAEVDNLTCKCQGQSAKATHCRVTVV